MIRYILFFVMLLTLSGCAQLVRNQAQEQVRAGQYEKAIAILEEGLLSYPDSPLLRSGLLSARAELVARIAADAAQQASAGRFDDAERIVMRGLSQDPKNERLLALKDDLRAQRRVQELIAASSKQAAAGQRSQAIQTLEIALREYPRHPAASSLKRQLEAELRIASPSHLRTRLAEGRPITLDFRGAALPTVLEAVTRGSGINFILDRDVRQDTRVTVFLRSAPVEEAIDLITSAHQLSRRVIDSETVLIYPNTPEKQREHQEHVIRVFHLGSADAKATAQLLRSMLKLKDAFVDERANIVAIREPPEVVAMAERLVALHDSGDPEVMMEVEVLEIRSSRLTELGLAVPSSISLTPIAPAGGLTISGLRDLNSDRIAVSIGSVTLNLKREVGDFNILANPRIRSKNREKARIMIGDRFPVVSTTTSATTALISESISYIDVGLKLEVEPSVSLDGDVTIKLALEVSAIAGSVRTAGGSIAYQVGTRNANTTLRLQDGETQILAGLISNDDRTSASRIPGLGDLPVAGRLFSSQKDEFQRTELVLAITPRIVRSAPRPDASQAELWVGTEASPRLREHPFNSRAVSVPVQSGIGTSQAQPSAGTPRAAVPLHDPAVAIVSLVGPSGIKTGSTFSASVNLATGAELKGAVVELTFPPDALEVMGIEEGPFFKQGGAQTSFSHSVNSMNGRISLAILRNDSTGVAGDAPLAQVQLRPKVSGAVDVKVNSFRPVGTGAGTLPASKTSDFRATIE